MAIGEVIYGDTNANEDEINLFLEALKFHSTKFTDAFITAPSPGIIVRAMIDHCKNFWPLLITLSI